VEGLYLPIGRSDMGIKKAFFQGRLRQVTALLFGNLYTLQDDSNLSLLHPGRQLLFLRKRLRFQFVFNSTFLPSGRYPNFYIRG